MTVAVPSMHSPSKEPRESPRESSLSIRQLSAADLTAMPARSSIHACLISKVTMPLPCSKIVMASGGSGRGNPDEVPLGFAQT
jgi:hypothetical protein